MKPSQIELLRADLDLTQAELARHLKVAQNTVSTWENGAAMGPAAALRVLRKWPDRCAALGITLESLVKHGRAA